MVGDRKYGVIEKSREFTLVPWRPVLERAIGKQVGGERIDAFLELVERRLTGKGARQRLLGEDRP